MAEYAPITRRIVDDQGKELFTQLVPFEPELDVRGVMERAFVLSQTIARPDPFVYDLQYYGYSEVAQFPGHMEYEIESICGKPNNQQYFWALKINDVLSSEGADSMQPGPGSTVLWTYTPIAQMQQLPPRAQVIHERRARRGVNKA
jgi:Domain of unknown function (DUF4430)